VGDYLFRPPHTRIEPGDAVEWSFGGQEPHTVTARPDAPVAFDSGELVPGDRFAVTFGTPGSYRYVCELHPSMRGVVQVGPDTVAPRLRGARAGVGPKRLRIVFRLSETARVGAVLKRVARPGRRALRARRLAQGRRSLVTRLAGLRPGAHTARLVASDREGNVARLLLRFRVPRVRG
jgi:hypothetical protein